MKYWSYKTSRIASRERCSQAQRGFCRPKIRKLAEWAGQEKRFGWTNPLHFGFRPVLLPVRTILIIPARFVRMSPMDPRVKKAVLEKIQAAVSNTAEVKSILQKLESLEVSSKDDLAFGIALGRIYNSFHYQTRRTLKRDATQDEFGEFLEILEKNAEAIRRALREQ